MLKKSEILSIGSVVVLKNNPNTKYIISGYYILIDNILHDYCAVRYPLGETKDSVSMTFNAADIKEVVFEGYKGEEYDFVSEALDHASIRFSEEIENGALVQE